MPVCCNGVIDVIPKCMVNALLGSRRYKRTRRVNYFSIYGPVTCLEKETRRRGWIITSWLEKSRLPLSFRQRLMVIVIRRIRLSSIKPGHILFIPVLLWHLPTRYILTGPGSPAPSGVFYRSLSTRADRLRVKYIYGSDPELSVVTPRFPHRGELPGMFFSA